MYWHLRDTKDDPRRIAMEIKKLDNEYVEIKGERKTKFEALGDESVKLANMLKAWSDESGKNFFSPNPKSIEFLLSSAMVKFISGGNRCLSGDSMIYDPVLDKERRLDQIDGEFNVLSWDGKRLVPAIANKPFLKGYDKLYRVILSNGESFVSTLSHQVLSDKGYTSVIHAYKHEQSLLFPRQTIEEPFPLIHGEDDQRLSKTIQGSQGGCHPFYGSYGEQPRLVLDNDQDISPLQADAQEYISYEVYEHKDVLLHKEEYSHPCQLVDLLSTQDALYQSEGQNVGIEYYASCKPCKSTSQGVLCSGINGEVSSRSKIESSPHQSICEFSQQANQYSLSTPLVIIDKVVPISTKSKPFYDFHVPVYNNYYYSGIIHHNSGKTTTCAIDIVSQAEGWHPMQRKNLETLHKDAKDSYEYYSAYERRWVKVDLSWVKEYAGWILDEKKWIAAPPVQQRCVTVDFPNGVEKFCAPEVIRWATKADLKDVQYANEKRRRITWKNGSFIEFMTTDQDLDAHGGTARHTVWFDEEPPSTYWMENMMRVISTRGRLLLGMTAVNGITWPKHEIWDKWEEIVNERFGS